MEVKVNTQEQQYKRKLGNQGFTLIEILIVVMVLGILAMVIVPQITVSTDDAKANTLQTNLVGMQNAVELYYYQHKNVYPGATGTDAADAAVKFLQQLTQYTSDAGAVSGTKDATHTLGPYIKGNLLPTNPYNNKNDVTCNILEADITVAVETSAVTTGWYFYTKTGKLVPYKP